MGIKIHHGPDGTYKTSGAIKDDILPVIKSGRILVTNVRGFSREKALKVLGKKFVHKDFKVIFVDTELSEGRDKLAKFFHWAPKGAFFVIDEVQRIFKPKWREKDLEALNYDGDSKIDDRPEDIHTAWDMQRHHNWDFVFTTTSITKVRAEMRDMAKIAVRHYNLGIWRFYKTVEHAADSRGTNNGSSGTIKFFNWVPKKVFALYSSTKTGTFENSEPRTAFYKDPKILSLLLSLVIFWSWLLSKPAPQALGGDTETSKKVNSKDLGNNKMVAQNDSGKVSRSSVDVVLNKQSDQVHVLDGFVTSSFITGSVYSSEDKIYSFHSNFRNQIINFTTLDLEDLGYKVKWIKPCKAEISRQLVNHYIYCTHTTFIKNKPPITDA